MGRELMGGRGADPSEPPASVPYRPAGVNSQHLVPLPQMGRGQDRTAQGRNLRLDYDRSGAHAWLKFRHLVFTPQTTRLHVVRLSVPSPQPVGGPRAVVWTNRPALQLPSYRLTGKPDAEVYAQARARAAARSKKR